MMRTVIVVGTLLLGVGAVVAQQESPSSSQTLMKGNGKNLYGADAAIVKGEKPYDQAAVDAALAELEDTAKKLPALFPDKPKGLKSRTATYGASPKIWKTRPVSTPRSPASPRPWARRRARSRMLDTLKAAFPPSARNAAAATRPTASSSSLSLTRDLRSGRSLLLAPRLRKTKRAARVQASVPFALSFRRNLLRHLAADFAARIGCGVDVDVVLAGRRDRRPARRSAWRCLRPGSRWRSGSQRQRRRSCRLRRARGNARRWRGRRGRNRSPSSSASCWRHHSRCRRCRCRRWCSAALRTCRPALPSSFGEGGSGEGNGGTQRKRGKHGLGSTWFSPC